MSNIPSEGTGNALSCAEMAIYLTLACLRSAPSMANSIQHGRVGVPLGKTLFGKRVLIVGFGGIAKELVPRCVLLHDIYRCSEFAKKSLSAELCEAPQNGPSSMSHNLPFVGLLQRRRATWQKGGSQECLGMLTMLSPCCRLRRFGVHVTAVRRSGWGQAGDAAAESLLDAKASWSEMASLTPEADIIIVACSQDATTRGFVNSAFLSACKAGVIIVNVARGEIPSMVSANLAVHMGAQ